MVLEFVKLEYHKSGISLISSATMFFCYKFLKLVVFGHFHPQITIKSKSMLEILKSHKLAIIMTTSFNKTLSMFPKKKKKILLAKRKCFQPKFSKSWHLMMNLHEQRHIIHYPQTLAINLIYAYSIELKIFRSKQTTEYNNYVIFGTIYS